MKLRTQTCIIGSGIAGSIVAYELLKGGNSDVVMVEAGKSYKMGSAGIWDDLLSTGISPFTDGYDEYSEYENAGTHDYKLRGSRLWGRGGTTIVWTGHAFRLKPEDFQLYTNTGRGVDWPIAYADMEPFYTNAETTLGVAGCEQDLGHPERGAPFPFPPFEYTADDSLYLDTFNSLDISFQHNCISRNRLPVSHLFQRPQCRLVGTCDYCPERARFTGDQLLDYLEAAGVTLLTNKSARRINFATKSQATSVEVLDLLSGELGVIEADFLIICGGAIESAKLLLNSRSIFWEKGLANDHESVGKFFTEHAAITVSGMHSSQEKNYRNIEKILAFNTACSRHYDVPEHQATGKFLIEVADVRAHDLPLKSKLRHRLDLQENWGHPPFALCALVEMVPKSSNCIELGTGHNRFGTPRTVVNFSIDNETLVSVERSHKILAGILKEIGCDAVSPDPNVWWPKHHMGTCRMSNSPEEGVVDVDLNVHGTRNVFVCSSAVFPTGGAANPTLTIAALAHRLGTHLNSMTYS